MEQKNKFPPLFVSIPHSGEKVPDECLWLKNLEEVTLMRDVDRYVDQLYSPALAELRIPSVQTQWHRYAADLNRFPDDVDQGTVKGVSAPAGSHDRGFHWRVTTHNELLIKEPIPMELHQKLVNLIYHPFHEDVRKHYEILKKNHSKIFHLDLHSMPSLGTKMHKDPGEYRADIVVSDCLGKSSESWFVDLVILAYVRADFKVAYNWPYVGGRVSEQYGHPNIGQNAVQVELNRALYMDENTKKLKTDCLFVIQEKLKKALKFVQEGLSRRPQ